MFQKKSVRMFPDRSVKMLPENSALWSPRKTAGQSQDRNAKVTFQDQQVITVIHIFV